MPRCREGPVKNKQTGYFFFDEYVGFPPDKKRIRISLRTKDPTKAQWLWEQEYKKQWSEFFVIEQKKHYHFLFSQAWDDGGEIVSLTNIDLI